MHVNLENKLEILLNQRIWFPLLGLLKWRHAGCKKVASNLKSLPLRFLYHFIASTVQCRIGSFTKVTADEIWLLEIEITGTKINHACFIINKMIKVMKDKDKKAKSKKKDISAVSVCTPLCHSHPSLCQDFG